MVMNIKVKTDLKMRLAILHYLVLYFIFKHCIIVLRLVFSKDINMPHITPKWNRGFISHSSRLQLAIV